jgi:hypothetical protein
MVRLLVLAVLLIGGGIAFRNQWIVVDWKKAGHDLGLPSHIDSSILKSKKKSPRQDGKPSW